jgi:RNA polymerase-interacting CarD/CdnL/TRCF family regulator
MEFEVGDRVVHPQHGVGYVSGLEEKQFEPNTPRQYYVVSIPDTTLWVPVDRPVPGVRRLSVPGELEACRQVLQSAPLALKPDRSLLGALVGQINQGTVVAHCEVVRDLAAYGWRKPLYGPLSEFQRTIVKVLCEEWAAVEELTLSEAAQEITALLKKGRAAHEH